MAGISQQSLDTATAQYYAAKQAAAKKAADAAAKKKADAAKAAADKAAVIAAAQQKAYAAKMAAKADADAKKAKAAADARAQVSFVTPKTAAVSTAAAPKAVTSPVIAAAAAAATAAAVTPDVVAGVGLPIDTFTPPPVYAPASTDAANYHNDSSLVTPTASPTAHVMPDNTAAMQALYNIKGGGEAFNEARGMPFRARSTDEMLQHNYAVAHAAAQGATTENVPQRSIFNIFSRPRKNTPGHNPFGVNITQTGDGY